MGYQFLGRFFGRSRKAKLWSAAGLNQLGAQLILTYETNIF